MTTTPRLDEVFGALASVHRRRLLMDLRNGHIPHLQRATRVVADGGRTDSEQLEVALFHTHLPKLDDAGFVTWNRQTGTIEPGPRFDDVEPVLELLSENHDRIAER
nr:hypothetical protein [Haloferax larsenii]